jgi:hypothetical protein
MTNGPVEGAAAVKIFVAASPSRAESNPNLMLMPEPFPWPTEPGRLASYHRDSGVVFRGIRRIKKDVGKGLNPDASKMFFQKGLITNWEYEFSVDTYLKRDLSVKQIAKRWEINNRILASVSKLRTEPRKPETPVWGPSYWTPAPRRRKAVRS